jgi:hypothetical protein
MGFIGRSCQRAGWKLGCSRKSTRRRQDCDLYVVLTSKTGLADRTAGILPPPLTKQSVELPRDELYDLHLARLARLSLHANVFLKVLPPVVESKVETWYDDKKELDRVIKMFRKLCPSYRTIPELSHSITRNRSIRFPSNRIRFLTCPTRSSSR